MKEIERFCDVSVSEVASHSVQVSGNQFLILTSRPTQLTIACTEGAKVETIQGDHLLTLTEACPKANTPDHFFVRNPHVVSSQQLIPLPLIHDAKEWRKEINATNEDVNLQEIFKELKKDHDGHVQVFARSRKMVIPITHQSLVKNRDFNHSPITISNGDSNHSPITNQITLHNFLGSNFDYYISNKFSFSIITIVQSSSQSILTYFSGKYCL